ncbi:hypothetical protein Hanom_Chr17g01564531 [Helianthus anomalus]
MITRKNLEGADFYQWWLLMSCCYVCMCAKCLIPKPFNYESFIQEYRCSSFMFNKFTLKPYNLFKLFYTRKKGKITSFVLYLYTVSLFRRRPFFAHNES